MTNQPRTWTTTSITATPPGLTAIMGTPSAGWPVVALLHQHDGSGAERIVPAAMHPVTGEVQPVEPDGPAGPLTGINAGESWCPLHAINLGAVSGMVQPKPQPKPQRKRQPTPQQPDPRRGAAVRHRPPPPPSTRVQLAIHTQQLTTSAPTKERR